VASRAYTNTTKGVIGANPDTYGKHKLYQSQDANLKTKDIDGASPAHTKFTNKVSYGLMSKDATGQLSARDIRKFHNPLDP